MNEKQRKARAYLRSYRVMVAQAEKCMEDYERAYDRAHKVTATLGECPGGGPSSDKVSEGAVEMLRHADELKVEHDRLTRLYRRRNEVIEAVAERNQLWGEVLSMVHVEGMKVSDVRRFLERDRRHIVSQSAAYQLYYRALEKAYDEAVSMGVRFSEGVMEDLEEGI